MKIMNVIIVNFNQIVFLKTSSVQCVYNMKDLDSLFVFIQFKRINIDHEEYQNF